MPRLFKRGTFWYCIGRHCVRTGQTWREAFDNWAAALGIKEAA